MVPLLRTYAGNGEGSWQEYCKVSAEDVIVIPDTISDETAAQLVVNPTTAYGLLKDLAPPEGSVKRRISFLLSSILMPMFLQCDYFQQVVMSCKVLLALFLVVSS